MIYIIGMKHSGKTTVGRLTAERLGLPFLDLDDVILSDINREHNGVFSSCRAVYTTLGGDAFRKAEAIAAARVAAEADTRQAVCALGGGAVENVEARRHLAGTGCFVYLRETPEILYERISRGGIPPFLDCRDPHADFLRLYGTREESFTAVADIVIDCAGRNPEAVSRDASAQLREAGYVG